MYDFGLGGYVHTVPSLLSEIPKSSMTQYYVRGLNIRVHVVVPSIFFWAQFEDLLKKHRYR